MGEGVPPARRLGEIKYDLKKKIASVLGGMVLVSTCLLLLFSFFWSHHLEQQFLLASVNSTLEGVHKYVQRQKDWRTEANLKEMRTMILRSVIYADPSIRRVTAYDPRGRVLQYLDEGDVQESRPANVPYPILQQQLRRGGTSSVTLRMTSKRGEHIGYLKADVKPVVIDFRRHVAPNLIVIAVMLGLSLGLTYFWATRLSRPLREVISVADEIASGAGFREVKTRAKDEAGVIAGLFNDINRRLQQRIDDLNDLNRHALDIGSELDRSTLHQLIVSKFAEITGAKKIAFLLCSPDGQRLNLVAGINLRHSLPEIPAGEGIVGQTISGRRHMATNDMGSHTDFILFYADRSEVPPGSWYLALPLTAQGKPSGVIVIGESSKAGVEGFDVESISLYQGFATSAGAAVENARLYELAITDELTRVYVRRFFNYRLLEEIDLASSAGAPLSLLMLDIDHFKRVNDTYGHQTGDVVLQAFANILKSAARTVDVRGAGRRPDIVSRLGGEEFAIILPNTPLAGSVVLAERIRAQVAGHSDIIVEDGTPLKFTVSIGAAEWAAGSDADALVRASDERLYEAKRSGRNRVCGLSVPANAQG